MITKERLEELIEQGATIYYYNPNAVNLYNLSGTPNVIELGKTGTVIIDDELETFITRFYTDGRMEKVYRNIYSLEYLFEDKEEFDWLLEFGNIERTEKLTLPTWEEVCERKEEMKCWGRKTIAEFDGEEVNIVVPASQPDKTYIEIYCRFCRPFTKENYIQACRLAKKLFLGE